MFAITRLYTVHLDPKVARPYESPIFVPDGFSFWAFAFHFFWAVYHRLWVPAIIFLVLLVGVKFAVSYAGLSIYSAIAMDLGIRLMIGRAANDLWRDTLEKRGYITSDVVIAESTLGAERRYFDRHLGQIAGEWSGTSAAPAHA